MGEILLMVGVRFVPDSDMKAFRRHNLKKNVGRDIDEAVARLKEDGFVYATRSPTFGFVSFRRASDGVVAILFYKSGTSTDATDA